MPHPSLFANTIFKTKNCTHELAYPHCMRSQHIVPPALDPPCRHPSTATVSFFNACIARVRPLDTTPLFPVSHDIDCYHSSFFLMLFSSCFCFYCYQYFVLHSTGTALTCVYFETNVLRSAFCWPCFGSVTQEGHEDACFPFPLKGRRVEKWKHEEERHKTREKTWKT